MISKLVSAINGTMEKAGAAHIASLLFPFEPSAASRPRVSKWGTYYLPAYKEWVAKAEAHLKSKGVPIPPDALLFVSIESVSTKAKTSKLRTPNHDCDNVAKGPLDAITKSGKPRRAKTSKKTGKETRAAVPADPSSQFWHDDKQGAIVLSAKRFAEPGEEAHTAVNIYILP